MKYLSWIDTLRRAFANHESQWRGQPRRRMIAIVEPVSTCNLRCPSCPVGNLSAHNFSQGVLRPERLEEILDKLSGELAANGFGDLSIWLYNWTEPLLNPRIGELITIAKRYASWVGISSNLSLPKKSVIASTLDAEPHAFKVSLSGYSQDVYQRGHARGSIELVKENLRFAARHIRERRLTIGQFFVGYHMYNDNLGGEIESMRTLCEELQIRFDPYIAYLSPLENIIDYLEQKPSGQTQGVVDRLLVRPEDVQEVLTGLDSAEAGCYWRDDMLVIDIDGKIDLCCRTYNQKIDIDFLRTPLSDIQAARNRHQFCTTCESRNWHRLDDPVVTEYFEAEKRSYLAPNR